MARSSAAAAPDPSDPRFTLSPAELVERLMAGDLALDLGTYPDADTGLYARISLDRRDKTSVERQLEIDIAYAQENRLSYVVYFDKGKSAYRPGVFRDDYDAALKAIRARRIKRLVSYKVDRLYRQVEELIDIIKIADGGRVPITLIGVDDDDEFDLTTGKGCDQAIGRVLEAQKESRRISERVKMQRQKAREKGIPGPGSAGFGWRDKTHHDDEQAAVLRQAYERILHGAALRALVVQWNSAGYKTARGADWSVNSLKVVLTNQRNVGRLTHTYGTFDDEGNKVTVTEVIKDDAFKPIVDRETFDAVQRVLVERTNPRRHPRRRSQLTGIVRCGRCDGHAMTRDRAQGVAIYRCHHGKARHIGCGLTINADNLQGFIEDALFKYVDSPGYVRRVAERRETGGRRAELIAKRDRLVKRREALSDAMLADDYDDEIDGYRKDVRKLGEKIRAIEAELELHRETNPAARWAGNAAGLKAVWDRFDDDEKRAIIKDALQFVTVKPRTRMGPGFDPERVEFGVDLGIDVAAH